VFDFISHFYQLFFFSFVFVYVYLADDHVNNASYFPFMSIMYFCVLREGYYVLIWPIVRICVFIKDWKLIYSELFILKRKSIENSGGSWHKLQHAFPDITHVIFLSCTSARLIGSYTVRQVIKTAARDRLLHGIVSQSKRPSIIKGVHFYDCCSNIHGRLSRSKKASNINFTRFPPIDLMRF
jgi:hypothetical protein